MKAWKLRYKIWMIVFLLVIAVNAAARVSTPAVDWYRRFIFPLWTNTLARVMSVFPFSVGEVLIYAGIFVLLLVVLFTLLGLLVRRETGRRAQKIKRTRNGLYQFVIWVLLWVALTETLNCFVLYHTTTVEEAYYHNKTYGTEELLALYTECVNQANALSGEMKRDAAGDVVYEGELYAACKRAMQQLGDTFPYLAGYYPNPKKILFSDFMSQQYLCGIYFPFTLESNYNATMYPMNDAATICHEFSHLKGIIREDEANYFGFLACIGSKDAYLQYSGYLSVLNYVAAEVKRTTTKDERKGLPKVDDAVISDIVFLKKEEWDRVEQKAVVSTKTVNKATNTFLESNLKANGVSDGMVSYSRVVRLLLDYYDGILWEGDCDE